MKTSKSVDGYLLVSYMLIGLMVALTIVGYFSQMCLIGDLASHFRVQYFFASLALALVLHFIFNSRFALLPLLCAMANLVCVLPLYIPKERSAEKVDTSLKLLQVNINSSNKDLQLFTKLLDDQSADIVCVQEISSSMAALLNARSDYPYKLVRDRSDNFGIALLSKLPVKDLRKDDFSGCDLHIPTITGTLDVAGRDVLIVCTHTAPPIGEGGYRGRNSQLRTLAEYVKASGKPCILAGDLNISSFSGHFDRLLEVSGLRNSESGHGFAPTWPSAMWPLLIAIDHVLVSKEFLVSKRSVGGFNGSDHFPVIVELAMKKGAQQ